VARYKRSEYSRGVMSAEQDKNIGWNWTDVNLNSGWVTLTFEQSPTTMGIKLKDDDWSFGYVEYWAHAHRNNL